MAADVGVNFIEKCKMMIRDRLPPPLMYRIRLAKGIWRARVITARNSLTSRKRNPLPAPLIVSLASFPPRFSTLHLTLKSLLNQSVTPDMVILWIANDDIQLLPTRVRRLESRGLTVRGCDEIGSYKKLIYALEEHSDSYIATADDDLFYDPTWLQTMVEAVDPSAKVVVCHRAHRIVAQEDGRLAPYDTWQMDVQDADARRPSTDLLPTTGGGVLYPPRSFSSEITDESTFQRLCPTADDLWFYWMARKGGSRIIKVGPAFPMLEWPSARFSSLWDINRVGGNDRQIRNLEAAFGDPMQFG